MHVPRSGHSVPQVPVTCKDLMGSQAAEDQSSQEGKDAGSSGHAWEAYGLVWSLGGGVRVQVMRQACLK